jgi:hypothetical protein
LLLVAAFNNHPHVIVSPSAKNMLQLKNVDSKKVADPKVLTQVGLGAIFFNIIKDDPTIKKKVGEHLLNKIISGLESICCFTNSYKQMCGCKECVGLHTLHCLLLAKGGIMHRQFAIDAQHCTRGVHAVESKGMGCYHMAPKAVAGHHRGHLHAMEFACCATLGVPDAPVW